jgi:hypothetical protein
MRPGAFMAVQIRAPVRRIRTYVKKAGSSGSHAWPGSQVLKGQESSLGCLDPSKPRALAALGHAVCRSRVLWAGGLKRRPPAPPGSGGGEGESERGGLCGLSEEMIHAVPFGDRQPELSGPAGSAKVGGGQEVLDGIREAKADQRGRLLLPR